jgi:signal transduction histidine kinase
VERDEEAAGRYRELMKKEIRRIDRIINDLLVYSRPARQDSGEPARTTVEEVIEHVRALLGPQKLFDRVEIDAALDGGPFAVAVARDDLTQVLINLLLNAAQAMGGSGRVTIRAERLDGWRMGLGVVARKAVRISVSDDGPGIPADHAGRIFDPFYSSRESGQGSGLGLAICQSICERAGGEIVLDADFEGGASFQITLLSAS